jgi:hypothetical protein
MNKMFNVEVNFPNGSWRTVQIPAETSAQAASNTLQDYPAADNVTAWLPGGPRGLDRTDSVMLTGFARATEKEAPRFQSAWLDRLNAVWL